MIYLYNLSVSNKLLASYTGVKAKKILSLNFFPVVGGLRGWTHTQGYLANKQTKKTFENDFP